ncbi:MAG: chromosome segregation protein SMC [Candidatus Omnitrophica bacterium]|nr:chromosome segregation protein SMC [Candidatus Omnitrophota bacterium]
MSLKKIEIFGFKSFADRTEVVFEPGVTCVVGPNGCGKSNISDSIRWVLGERSAKLLRGSKMEDVIFNGTDYRKPLGFSEVHLTIDNRNKILPIEYEEVVISRKIYRSGESEYSINKTICRYKDIQDLILDTGIGSNSYSMIEQGRIDYILSADPDERRFLIEEAAGISKFKTKKEEAIKKLERTEENLLRLGDIIAEVEKNIKYAERQAKRAEKYREQFDTLKKLEIKKASWELNNLDSIKTELETKKLEMLKRQTELQTNFAEKESSLKENRNKIQNLESDLSFGELKKIELVSKINSLRDKIYFNVERIGSLKNQWLEAEGEIASSEEQIKSLRQEIEKTEKEVIVKETELAARERELDIIRQTLEKEKEKYFSIKKSLEELRSKQLVIAREKSEHHNEKVRLESSISGNRARTEQKSRELESLNQDGQSLQTQISKIRENEKQLAEQKSILEESLGVVQENLRIKETEIDGVLSRMLKAEDRRKEIRAHIDVLTGKISLQNTGGVFKEFDERRKDVSSKLFGKAWFLKESVKPKSGREEIFHQLLSVFSEDVLIFNIHDAFSEIKTLTQKSSAFPIVSLLTNDLNVTPATFCWSGLEFVPISEHIDFNNSSKLFTNTYSSSKLGEELIALDIQQITSDKQILSSDGILIGPGAFITFPKGKDSGFSTDQISELTPEKEMLEHQLAEYEEREKRLKREKAEMSEGGSRVQEDLQKIRTELESEFKLGTSLVATMDRIQEKISFLSKELETSNLETLNFEKLIQEHTLKTAELDGEENTLQQELTRLNQFEQEQSSVLEAEKMKQVRHETEVTSLRERFILLSSHLKQSRDAVQTETNTYSTEIDEMVKTQSETDISLANVKEHLESERRLTETFEQEVDSLRSALETLKEELHQADYKAMESGYAKNSILDRVRQAYKIDLESETNHIPLSESENIDEISTQITALKEKLESYGAVNLLAVDEFNELKTRFDFLVTQKTDLVNARDALLDAIRKINRTTKQLFEDTFKAVQINFQGFFETLFKGGHAQLTLLDEDNPLESGIEIMVRPPGKKLQQISLLSGGEKALTAIALLFSLFKIKPSPFCVLDEVDAPLDEANIDRFLTVLRSFLDSTQFIIITHNRKTISMGDALYGVTMEETGVSKIVSVRVSQSEKSTQLLSPAEIA